MSISSSITITDTPCYFCIHGECLEDDKCKCDDGWGGPLCDKVATKCKNGLVCLNGSECKHRSGQMYTCDCEKLNLDSMGPVYAGEECEYEANEYCIYGISRSTTAFCTNQGTCNSIVITGVDSHEEFKGCSCPDGYEGDHCEIPLSRMSLNSSQKGMSDEVGVLAFVFGFVLFASFFFWAFTFIVAFRNKVKSKHEIQTAVDRDLHIEPDGELIRNVNEDKEHDKQNDTTLETIEDVGNDSNNVFTEEAHSSTESSKELLNDEKKDDNDVSNENEII